MKPKTIAILVLATLCLILLVQNAQVVSVKFFLWEVSMSRIIMFPLLILVGFFLGFAVGKAGGRQPTKNRTEN